MAWAFSTTAHTNAYSFYTEQNAAPASIYLDLKLIKANNKI